MGLMTPVGATVPETRSGIQKAVDGFSPITLFNASRYRCKKGGQIAELVAEPGRSRASCMIEKVVREAFQQAGWSEEMSAAAPVCLGTTNGGMFEGEQFFRELHAECPREDFSRLSSGIYPISRQLQDLEWNLNLMGRKIIFSNACASGANSIGHAFHMIHDGVWDRAIAGGYDALCELSFAGFDSLRSFTTTQCRPFSKNRNGLLLGEGAGVMCLESESSARKRGATLIAEVLGYGATTDTYHHTQHNPNGKIAARSMSLAMDEGRIAASDIGYINAHGTGTLINDSMEATAVEVVFGADAASVRVSSNKAAIGHLLGAAGSVEAILTALSVSEKWISPTLHVDEVDPICKFRLVQATEEAPHLRYALTNSFGFGGACASLLLGAVP